MRARKLLIVTAVATLLGAYCLLGTGYRAQYVKNRALAAQFSEVVRQLAEIPLPPADLSQRRAAASASVEKQMDLFPEMPNSTRLIDGIFRVAEATGVKALPAATWPWTSESISGLDYPVFHLNLTVSGAYHRVADFLDRLENGDPVTLVIRGLTIECTVNPQDESGEVEAAVDVAVYARPSLQPETQKR